MKKAIRSIIFIFITCLNLHCMTSCTTGSTLRTARVLEENQLEISAGAAFFEGIHASQVVIAAYGITNSLEIEGRWEDQYAAATPRLQILKSEKNYIDALTFFELGYSSSGGFQWGPGVTLGRQWKCIEPYVSYRFRHFSSVSKKVKFDNDLKLTFKEAQNYHYLKFGNRFYISDLWTYADNLTRRKPRFFIDLEIGPTFCESGTALEWAANFGFNY